MPRPPSQLREQILDAALLLLKTRGERAMTQTRVAAEAGIPQGHLTYYFPKKRDLVLGVAERFAEVTANDLVAFFAEQRGRPVREAIVTYTEQMIADRERTRMLLGMLVLAEAEPQLAEMLRENAVGLRRMLATGLERQEDDPAVDLLLALLWGLGIHDFVLRERNATALLRAALVLLDGDASAV